MNALDQDRELIKRLGGPTKVAELLGFPVDGGPQRVGNWVRRGIPDRVKVTRPDLFLARTEIEPIAQSESMQ